MIPFLDPAADEPLAAELKDAGLLAPDILGRIEAALGRPETATLNEMLLAGAEWIPEKAWLSWLIRAHGCHRHGPVAWTEEMAEWARRGVPPEGNLPYRLGSDNLALVALMRPDLKAGTERRFAGPTIAWSAATLAEMRELHRAWSAAAGQYLT